MKVYTITDWLGLDDKEKKGELLFEDIWQINGDCGITGRFAISLAGLPEGL